MKVLFVLVSFAVLATSKILQSPSNEVKDFDQILMEIENFSNLDSEFSLEFEKVKKIAIDTKNLVDSVTIPLRKKRSITSTCSSLQSQLNTVQAQIANTTRTISTLSASITTLTTRIEDLRIKIESTSGVTKTLNSLLLTVNQNLLTSTQSSLIRIQQQLASQQAIQSQLISQMNAQMCVTTTLAPSTSSSTLAPSTTSTILTTTVNMCGSLMMIELLDL